MIKCIVHWLLLSFLSFSLSCSKSTAPPDDSGPGSGTWNSRANMPTPRQEMPIALLDGKIYVPGGFDGLGQVSTRLEVYDPASDTWSTPTFLPQPRHHFGMAAVNGKLYIIGGYPGLPFRANNQVFEYDPATDNWETKSPMPTARGGLIAVAAGDLIYAIGGADGPALGTIEIFDAATNSWVFGLPDMPTAREHLSGAHIDGKVYVAGGRFSNNGGLQNVATLEAFDTQSGQWEQLPNMPTARGGLAAAALNGRLYVFGGEFPGIFAQNEEYDPVNQSWRSVAPLPTPRHGMGAVAVGNQIYVIGGGPVAGFGVTGVNEAFTISLP